MRGKEGFVNWFSELKKADIAIAGGKGASLAEMYNNKFPVPPGFVITAGAYRAYIEQSGIGPKIGELLKEIDVDDPESLNEASKNIRGLIEGAQFPKELGEEIRDAYDVLDVDKQNLGDAKGGALDILRTGHEPPFVAVRSSATTEDLDDASFAGQQESFLNIKGEASLLKAVKKCFSSLFTSRAMYYRIKKGFGHDKSYLAVVVQKMIDSEKSGVIFSKNPVKEDNNLVIEAVWGLGEGIVSGRIKPDHYLVSRDLDNLNIIESQVADKKIAIVRDSGGMTGQVSLSAERSTQQVLSSYEIKRLGQYAIQLEKHYEKPQDIEFAIENKEIYIVQSRPITALLSGDDGEDLEGETLLSGLGSSPGIGSGPVKIVRDMSELAKVKKGDVLVTKMTNPDMVVAMQKAAAIVTDEGGLTSHAAIVSREMGIPSIVGTGEATSKLKEGQVITVDGGKGRVVDGRSETKLATIDPIEHETKTKIKVIVDLPEYAERAAKSGAKAVGLVRLEGIIASFQKHPMKYVKEGDMGGYIKTLSEGLKKLAGPFNEVWVRSSDIRSDEYRNLEGAPKEVEGNPMLGDHGIRFSLKHPEIMKAELEALKEVADDLPEKKFGFMIPQVISVSDFTKTKEIAQEVRMPNNIKLGIMVETPAAVQVINSLCEAGIEFVSFGTNDLTQYTLAIDRNNSDVQDLYDAMNPAILSSLMYVIRRCKKYGVETSICGQAGSKPEMARFLVEQGIDSISVNADAAALVAKVVSEVESSSSKDPEPVVEEKVAEKEEEKVEEKVEEKEEEKPEEKVGVAPEIAPIANKQAEDVEDIILRELEGEYHAGPANGAEEMPKLNDSIPVESGDIEAQINQQVRESVTPEPVVEEPEQTETETSEQESEEPEKQEPELKEEELEEHESEIEEEEGAEEETEEEEYDEVEDNEGEEEVEDEDEEEEPEEEHEEWESEIEEDKELDIF